MNTLCDQIEAIRTNREFSSHEFYVWLQGNQIKELFCSRQNLSTSNAANTGFHQV